ncbi:hypothetical protein ANCCAN_00259 [Ancylostoma caninum]|uniref:Uncharacterized protein n=1 Tax=Ancylostoma caninum TaxID=29170 RepID=A0A368HEW9_ANCCA|nr:hypothetical protein ANCCAN_00259 [Ancylostoma caninum]
MNYSDTQALCYFSTSTTYSKKSCSLQRLGSAGLIIQVMTRF